MQATRTKIRASKRPGLFTHEQPHQRMPARLYARAGNVITLCPQVNKPYLPLASGEFSKETGIALTVGTGALSILICLLSDSPALTATVVVSLLLGIVYSIELPFMRWKRSPVLAAGCILVVRALAVQLGFYFHMQTVLARQQLAPALAAAAAWKPVSLVSIGAGMQVTPAILFTLCFM